MDVVQEVETTFPDVWEKPSGKEVVVHVQENSDVVLVSPSDGERVTILVDKNVEVVFFEEGSGTYTVDILCKDNANVRYYSKTTTGSAKRFCYLERDASIFWIDATYGTAKVAVTSYLADKGADAEFHSVFLGSGSHTFSVTSKMIHAGSHSTSNMVSRAVMLGKSKGNYEGLIRILPEAKGCDAYQKEDTLLLSPEAHMDATPNLEISNEDVRCSHGVSLGQVDDEKLFYFLSRGIPKKEAVQLIVQGFFDEILDGMQEHGTGIRKDILQVIA
ncbi:MAG: SufD family Fe-S cluster assembly protein [Candidatus Woesearchaeota archaeon]|nr:SufD family Fe-S cluster assembly protein [Candidatus Woesearchaeota archaeon]